MAKKFQTADSEEEIRQASKIMYYSIYAPDSDIFHTEVTKIQDIDWHLYEPRDPESTLLEFFAKIGLQESSPTAYILSLEACIPCYFCMQQYEKLSPVTKLKTVLQSMHGALCIVLPSMSLSRAYRDFFPKKKMP